MIVVEPTGRSVGARVRGGLVREACVVASHRGSLRFLGSLHENVVVGAAVACGVVQRGSSAFAGSEHEKRVVGR